MLNYTRKSKLLSSIFTDDSEAVRCNSQLAYFNAAFSSVSPGAGCPVPSHLYLYKVCHDRIGVASELDSVADFPTDYLYVYKLNSQNEVNCKKLFLFEKVSYRKLFNESQLSNQLRRRHIVFLVNAIIFQQTNCQLKFAVVIESLNMQLF